MIQIAEMRINDNHMPSFIKKWVKDVREDPQDIIKVNKEIKFTNSMLNVKIE